MAFIVLNVQNIERTPMTGVAPHGPNDAEHGSLFLTVDGVSIQLSGTEYALGQLGVTIQDMAMELGQMQEKAKMTPLV